MFEILIAQFIFATSPITPDHLYNGVDRSVMVQVVLPEGEDLAHVVLLDQNNKLISKPAAITEGQHDLLRRLPKINSLQNAAWVQLL
ncbi:MAG TPA: hypothetical protein QF528_00475, partial [Phycisphaerales bacterium]|nr:hypothetical protein [Phycisphaerales bacterium]